MGTALFVLLWWLALVGWWIVLVGTNAGLHLVGQRHLSSRYRAFDSPSADADPEQPVTRPSELRPRG